MMLHAVLTLVVNAATADEPCSNEPKDFCVNYKNYNSECAAVEAQKEKLDDDMDFWWPADDSNIANKPQKSAIQEGQCEYCSEEKESYLQQCMNSVTYSNDCERKEAEKKAHVKWWEDNKGSQKIAAWQPSFVSWGPCQEFKVKEMVEVLVCPNSFARYEDEDMEEMTLAKCAFTCQANWANSFLYGSRTLSALKKCICGSGPRQSELSCRKKEKKSFFLYEINTITPTEDGERKKWSEWSTFEQPTTSSGFRTRMAISTMKWLRQVEKEQCSKKKKPVCMNNKTYNNECDRLEAEKKAHADWFEKNKSNVKVDWQPSSLSEGACNVCELPILHGSCKQQKMLVKRWAMNPWTGQCEEFFYGGCGGNGNKFEKKEDCEKQCKLSALFEIDDDEENENEEEGDDKVDDDEDEDDEDKDREGEEGEDDAEQSEDEEDGDKKKIPKTRIVAGRKTRMKKM